MTGSNTRELASSTIGSGEDVVVLIHGWMANGRIWERMSEELVAAGATDTMRFVFPDLRGAAGSRHLGGDVALSSQADAVLALLDRPERERPKRLFLVGHSMGGPIAALVAARLGARATGLYLMTPVPPGGLALPPEVAQGFRAAGGNRAALRGILVAATRRLPEAERERMVDDAMSIDPDVIARGFDAWTAGGVEAEARTVQIRTKILATDDPFLPPALLETSWVKPLPRATMEHLPGPGHYPQVEAPADTAARLLAFLREGAR